MFPLKTFAPDANYLTPEVVLDLDGGYPSENGGIASLPAPSDMSEALASTCLGCFSFSNLSGNFRTLAGTSTKLYELAVNTTWTDVSKAGNYSTANRWRFVAWGNWAIATCYDAAIQVQKTQTGTFANLGGSPPQAKFITTARNFVVVAHIYGHTERVQWCAQGNAEDWTVSTTTQAGYNDLSDTPGQITGLAKLGEYIVVFKESAIYLGEYIGPPVIWSFRRIGSYFGTLASDAIVETEKGIFYPANDDFFMFDGNYPQRIGAGVRKWFLDRLDRTYATSMFGAYDGLRKLIFWFFPTNDDSTGACVDCLIYDVQSYRWGRKQISAEVALVQWSPSVTYDTIATFFSTYDLITSPVTYDDPFWSETSFAFAYIGTDHKLKRLAGTSENSNMTTHYQGNPVSQMEIYQVWPYFTTEPSTCVVSPLKKTTLGTAASTGTGSTVTNGKADIISSSRYHALHIALTGNYEIVGIDVDAKEISRN